MMKLISQDVLSEEIQRLDATVTQVPPSNPKTKSKMASLESLLAEVSLLRQEVAALKQSKKFLKKIERKFNITSS